MKSAASNGTSRSEASSEAARGFADGHDRAEADRGMRPRHNAKRNVWSLPRFLTAVLADDN